MKDNITYWPLHGHLPLQDTAITWFNEHAGKGVGHELCQFLPLALNEAHTCLLSTLRCSRRHDVAVA